LWMGNSVGRFEGDTLVVETIGFNEHIWLNSLGAPHSDVLKLTERYRLVAGGEGSARIVLTGRGAGLPLPELPLLTPVTAQLVRGDGGGCWDATFSTARKNTATRFKARAD